MVDKFFLNLSFVSDKDQLAMNKDFFFNFIKNLKILIIYKLEFIGFFQIQHQVYFVLSSSIELNLLELYQIT